jgi:hypothetical protein
MGGGAGIRFKTNGSTKLYIEASVSKKGLNIKSLTAEPSESFNARGYDDGMDNVKIDLLTLVMPKKKDVAQAILQAKVEREIVEKLTGKSVGEVRVGELGAMLAKPIDVYTEVNFDYDDMSFGGYVRGTFKVGDVVMGKADINGDYSFMTVDGHRNYYDPEGDIAPTYEATQDFIYFYQEVFSSIDENISSLKDEVLRDNPGMSEEEAYQSATDVVYDDIRMNYGA